jgi:hypothetical protein
MIFLCTNLSYILLGYEVIDKDKLAHMKRNKMKKHNFTGLLSWFSIILHTLLLFPMLIIPIIYPKVSLVLYVAFPIMAQIIYLFKDSIGEKGRHFLN